MRSSVVNSTSAILRYEIADEELVTMALSEGGVYRAVVLAPATLPLRPGMWGKYYG